MVPFQNCIRWTRDPSKMAAISGHSFNIGPYGKNNEKSSYLKLLGQPNFDGMFLGWSQELYPLDGPSKMAAISGHSFNIGPYGKNNEKSSCLKLLGQLGPFDGMVLGFQNCIRWTPGPSKMAAISGHSFNIGPYGKNNEKSSCLKQHGQWGLNFDGMVLGWSPFRIVSVGPQVHPRWLSSADIVLT